MKPKEKKLVRRCKAAICTALVAAVCFSVSLAHTLALTSLPHIEEIVSSSNQFNILEIVPEKGSGSIGYYVEGQEPVESFNDLLAGKTSQSARAAAAGELFTHLRNRGLLGDNEDTPLTASGTSYTEKKPWQMENSDFSSMVQLVLKSPEEAQVTGDFQSADTGDYDKVMELALSGAGGDHIQKISQFRYSTETEEGTYYYNPVFLPVTAGETLADGTAIYANTANDGVDAHGNEADESTGDPADGTYYYIGSWGDAGLALDINTDNITYYIVSSTGQPYTTCDSSHPYAAVSDDYIKVEDGKGYFSLVRYRYMGTGLGHYRFVSTGTKKLTIEYDTVWYSLGYQNNDWFLRYVFDRDDTGDELTETKKHMTITVHSWTPDEVTAADVAEADLIVLSAGFNLSTGGNCASSYASGNDIDAKGTGGVYDAIIVANGGMVPIMVDSALTTGSAAAGTNIAALASELKGVSSEESFVSGNLYYYTGALATADFNEKFTDTTGFTDILSEIANENFLRKKDDPSTTDLLPNEVTMANCIRYIINYAGQRQVGVKDKITVLELEPGRGKALTPETVWQWIGGTNSGINKDDIQIVTMSTSEFIGKIDSLVESYDMIYIGADLEGLNTTVTGSKKTTVYNDKNMNGLIYTNIGDVFYAKVQLAGLLDRDYYQNADGTYPRWTANGTSYKYIDARSSSVANRFRFSGNDLTGAKAEELLDFVKSGYPVVVSDDLVYADESSGFSVNTARVDSASYMYSALCSIESYQNVMTVSQAQKKRSTLCKYLNLSKPSIEWVSTGTSENFVYGYPTVYSLTTDAEGNTQIKSLKPENGKYYLHYAFIIRNKTDATPKTTTYDCRLYIDLNSDGLYKPNEQINDIVIRNASGQLVSPVRQADGTYRYSLKADEKYMLTRQMPTDYAGIVPWKLEVVKNNNEYIHASEINYTHIEPTEPEKIQILQINSDSYTWGADASSYTLNLEEQLDASEREDSYHKYKAIRKVGSNTKTMYFHGLFGKLLYEASDFEVSIKTISASDFNSMTDPNGYLSGFNMLIIGFGDMYQDLDEDSANAVVDFIDSGKAVLYTHDTTSLMNVPSAYTSHYSFVQDRYHRVSSYRPTFSDPAHWGYYFNTILRDAVKLDRYGIRSKEYRNYLKDQTSSTDLTPQEINELTKAGYSVAYTPKSERTEYHTEAETQGFTNYALIRYSVSNSQLKATDSKYSGGRVTQTVSQVNQGQITTYPYDINTEYFKTGSGDSYMTVSPTHEQYYQLNMNSEDIVVWYCLSNGSGASTNQYYAALPNDVINSYYIYNCGNITYSGMGHFTTGTKADSYYTGGNTKYIDEAKLFVNTMIAAYRTADEKPTISFTSTASGEKTAEYFFVTSDYTTDSATKSLVPSGDMVNSDSRIYFKIYDPTLQQNKKLALTFYYTLVGTDGNEIKRDGKILTTQFTPTVYNADTGAAVSSYSGGLVYDFRVPSAVLSALQEADIAAVNIYISVSASMVAPINPDTDSKIQIRPIGLFALS